MAEKKYIEFSKSAKRGCNKYGALSSAGMEKYAKKYRKKTGKNPYAISSKEYFYEWVSRNHIR